MKLNANKLLKLQRTERERDDGCTDKIDYIKIEIGDHTDSFFFLPFHAEYTTKGTRKRAKSRNTKQRGHRRRQQITEQDTNTNNQYT